MQEKKQIFVSFIYIAVIVFIILAFAYFNKTETPVVTDGNNVVSTSTINTATSTIDTPMDIFAKCVAAKGVTMYGAAWCSHCQNEKSHFGSSFKYVPYVECPDNAKLCEDKGVLGYPTWIDAQGNKHEGEQGIDGLAKISGCSIPK